jgi:KDO2-lipid IV(A) lauroyltransferase
VPIADSGRLRDKVATATQELADAFAADIALRPHDWHMLQRLWLSDLPGIEPAAAEPATDEPSGAG